MTCRIKFCGAAGTVTGSCYWITLDGTQFLIDCGMFQGSKTLKALNYGPFPFDPAQIDFVVLTHAHVDHTGLVPRLIRDGFGGPVYTTQGSRDLLSYMWPDSGYIQETEVEFLNRRRVQRGKAPVHPIYTKLDGEAAIGSVRTLDYEEWRRVAPTVRVRFWNAGHILGAASVELEIQTQERDARVMRLLFSGDIGPEHKLFHPDPDAPGNYDYVICEATYGGRNRLTLSSNERRAVLAEVVNEALKKDGILLIPAFAIERTQELLVDLAMLLSAAKIPNKPIFLDSPLAIRATRVFESHKGSLEDLETLQNAFRHPAFHFTESVEQSRAIGRFAGGMIVIAASGMCDAGRVRHHLKNLIWREETTLLLVGYQAPGTAGRLLEQGAKRLKIQGEDVQVRAKVRSVDLYSGHADGKGLVNWVAERQPIKRALFLTHGEEEGLEALRSEVASEDLPLVRILVPRLDDEYDLLGSGMLPEMHRAPRRLQAGRVGGLDWHNRLAQVSLTMRNVLEAAPDDPARERLLKQVSEILDKEWESQEG